MPTSKVAFPFRGILQPALTLAYLSTYAVPVSFVLLPSELAGFLIGLSTIVFTLIGFRLKRNIQAPNDPLTVPLMGPPAAASGSIRYNESLLQGSIIFLFINSIIEGDLASSLTMGINIYAVVSDVGSRHLLSSAVTAVGSSLILRGTGCWNSIEGVVIAISAGVLFHSLASYSLPIWDTAHQSKFGFNLSSAAVLTLFIGLSTLELIS